MNKFIKNNRFILIVLLIGALLLLPNLGNRFIFGDEMVTVILGDSILEKGYPNAEYNDAVLWDKDTTYISKEGNLLWTWNAWLQFYLLAFFYATFGFSEFISRFPFVLISLGSIYLFYYFARKITKNEMISRISTILLLTSVTFLLHARQARWYSLVIFFTLACCYSYLDLVRSKKNSIYYFVISSVLLFHSNFFIFFSVFFGLTLHYVIFKYKFNLKNMIKSYIGIFVFTFPWFIYTGQLSKTGDLQFGILRYVLNLFLNYYYVFILLFPFVFLLVYIYGFKKDKKYFFTPNNIFMIFFVVFYLFFLSLKSDLLPAIRYVIAVLPFFCILSGVVVYYFLKKNRWVGYGILLLLILTNIFYVFPFDLLKEPVKSIEISAISDYEKNSFVDDSLSAKFYLLSYLYEITHNYDSSEELIINYMLKTGSSNDNFLTNYFMSTFQFYTNMNLASMDDEKINWIIIRDFKVNEENNLKFINQVEKNIDLNDYKKILVHNKDKMWGNTPDPINHRFRTNKDGTVVVYHLK